MQIDFYFSLVQVQKNHPASQEYMVNLTVLHKKSIKISVDKACITLVHVKQQGKWVTCLSGQRGSTVYQGKMD